MFRIRGPVLHGSVCACVPTVMTQFITCHWFHTFPFISMGWSARKQVCKKLYNFHFKAGSFKWTGNGNGDKFFHYPQFIAV